MSIKDQEQLISKKIHKHFFYCLKLIQTTKYMTAKFQMVHKKNY